MTAELVAAWVGGWTISRGLAPAYRSPEGWTVEVGLSGHRRRHVLAALDGATVAALAARISEPGVWLKVCADPAVLAPLLPAGWRVEDRLYLMSAPLAAKASAAVPPGYDLTIAADGDLLRAEARTLSGALAASGKAALSDRFATFDQIVTDPDHRRRGLGRALMEALAVASARREAHTGVLVATEDGHGLYCSLGWGVTSLFASAVFDPEAAMGGAGED